MTADVDWWVFIVCVSVGWVIGYCIAYVAVLTIKWVVKKWKL